MQPNTFNQGDKVVITNPSSLYYLETMVVESEESLRGDSLYLCFDPNNKTKKTAIHKEWLEPLVPVSSFDDDDDCEIESLPVAIVYSDLSVSEYSDDLVLMAMLDGASFVVIGDDGSELKPNLSIDFNRSD